MRIEIATPSIQAPPSFMFGPPTHRADSWVARDELVLQPPFEIMPGRLNLIVEPGDTRDLGYPTSRRPLRRLAARGKPIDRSGSLIFDSRYETDGNVAHQIYDVLLRVLLAGRELAAAGGPARPITVVLRNNAAHFTRALYEEFGVPTLETDAPVVGDLVRIEERLTQTRLPGEVIDGGSNPSWALADRLMPLAPIKSSAPDDLPEKLFIARRGARAVENHEEVARLLARRGYVEVFFETLPVGRQILLARHAKAIVSVHGAALAYMLFNPNGLARPKGDLSGLRIIELFGAGYIVDIYRRFAATMNAHWCAVRGLATPEIVRDLDVRKRARSHQASSFPIHLQTLEKALDYSEGADGSNWTKTLWDESFPSPV